MRICIPVEQDRGFQSPVCLHFGSAPLFMLVDTDTRDCRALRNGKKGHAHGLRKPLASLSEEAVDAVVVGGIGTNAVKKLHAAGIAVFRSEFSDVEETVDAHARGALQPVRPDLACGRGRQEP